MKRLKRLAVTCLSTLLAAGSVLAPLSATAVEPTNIYGGAPVTAHTGGYDYGFNTRKMVTHKYDFSMERLGDYAADDALAMSNRALAELRDGTLTTKAGQSFAIGSAVGLGDDYGLEEGYLSFDMKLTGGALSLGVRLSETAADSTKRGIWFAFDGSDTLRLHEPECGLEATVPMPVSTAEARRVTLHEGLDTLTLACGDTVLAVVKYTEDGYLAFCDGAGQVQAETSECRLYPTGYFSIYMQDIDGYVDNLVFTNVEETWNIPEADELRTVDYSTWTATDDLDRTVADNATAGDPKDNRYVGLFYFLCWVGGGVHVQDNTKLYLELGAAGAAQYIDQHGGEAYWAEPYFGYYRNTDAWVYRKHAYMLKAAGVDFIYLDVSNAETYIPGHTTLFDTWLEMRHQGIDTPQIIFFNGDMPTTFQSNMQTLFTTVYSDGNWDKYQELFFQWEGKPLILGNASGLSGEIKQKVNEKFTVRGSWAWVDKDNYWPWLQEYIYRPSTSRVVQLSLGGWGRDAEGNFESLSVALGHHATTSKGRSYVNGRQPNNGLGDMEFSSVEQAGRGLCFESQFSAMNYLVQNKIAADAPFVMMITGWNEWIAGCFRSDEEQPLANTTAKFYYVDQFNAEFSRDAEPMRNADGYGFGDNYYYQMVDYIRRYKGVAPTPTADHQGTIDLYDLSTWEDIELTYMDSLYDVAHRNTVSYDAAYRYINNTGRNDFEYAKVSQDEDNLYFLVKTSHDIIMDDGSTWMNLYLNVDGDTATGWEGYDYILNRDRDSFVVTVEKFKDGSFESEVVGGAYYYLEGAYLTVRLSKELIGVSGKLSEMTFKWADNSVDNGDPMAFMDLGDTAPDNRFAYRYLCDDYTTTPVEKTTLRTETRKEATNGTAVPKPDTDMNLTLREDRVDKLFDLTDIKAGLFIQDTYLVDYFEFQRGTNNCTVQVLQGDDDQYLRLKGFCDLRTWNDVEGAYVFSSDIHMVDYGNSAIYVRGEMPGAYTPVNPKNFNVDTTFNYYEWDWYAENGGKTFGGSSTAGSGIGIYPDREQITIRIKRYAPDGLGIASASYSFPYDDDFRPDTQGWCKLRVTDDGETVSIYFNDVLMCLVKLEEPGVVYDSDGTGQEYFGRAILCDAVGQEVLTVENTRLNSEGSQIALTTRNQIMECKNLYISYATKSIEGNRVETPLRGDSGEVDYTPDSRLLTTLNLGKPSVSDKTDRETIAADTSTPAESVDGTRKEENDTQASGGKGCRSALLPSAVLLMAAAGACLLRRRRE